MPTVASAFAPLFTLAKFGCLLKNRLLLKIRTPHFPTWPEANGSSSVAHSERSKHTRNSGQAAQGMWRHQHEECGGINTRNVAATTVALQEHTIHAINNNNTSAQPRFRSRISSLHNSYTCACSLVQQIPSEEILDRNWF